MNADADRDLLFGLLALQIGLVDQAGLLVAFHAWTRDRSRGLADHLVALGQLDADDRAAVAALVQRHLNRHGGDPGRSLDALPSSPPTTDRLAALGDPDLNRTLARVGSAATGPGEEDPFATRLGGDDGGGVGSRFRKLRPHARGGLGVVSVALDAELNREVALKEVQDRHADDPASRARFLLEAEVTGRLEHPGVVPVYSLGRDDAGRPYYAMRFVRGESLKEAIDRFHQLDEAGGRDPGERALAFRSLLGRFVDVCDAVAYAHGRGVIHRDLKPANILLGPYGETLVVDWGLAKVVGRDEPAAGEAEATLRPESLGASSGTLDGTAVGTPAYMSPEQAEGRLEALSPASDVYSLGATLYALLTGRAPFSGGDVGTVLDRVRRGDFPPPRQANRRVPAALEAVCLKAMALRPADRYASARALAGDVDRWLADEPVSVHREPLPVRLARWGRRHRTLVVGAATLTLTAAVGLAVGATLLARANARTREQRDLARRQLARALTAEAKAAAINDFLTKDVLGQASPEVNARGARVTVEQALDQSALKIDTAFVGQPEVEAAVRRTIGQTYYALGLYEKAERHWRRAHEIHSEAHGPGHPDTLSALGDVALALGDQGRLDEAEPRLRRALAGLRNARGPEHPDTLAALNNLAALLAERGRPDEAEPLFREAAAIRARTGGPEHPETLGALGNLVWFLIQKGRLDEAEPLALRVLEARRRVLGPEHPDTLKSTSNLAMILKELGRLSDAERPMRDVLDATRRALGPEHPDTIRALNNLANVYYDQDKLAAAEPLLRESLELRRRHSGPTDTALALGNLAALLEARGKLAEAEPLYRRAIDLHRDALGPEHPAVLTFQNNLALLLRSRGRLDDSEALFRQILEVRLRTRGPEHLETLGSTLGLGIVQRLRGRLVEAEGLLGRVRDGFRSTLPAGHPYHAHALAALGYTLVEAGRPAEAEPLLREALELRLAALPEGHRSTAAAELQLAACLADLGRRDDAEPLLRHALTALGASEGYPSPESFEALDRVIRHDEAHGHPAEARGLRLQALALAFPPEPFA